MRHGLRVGFRLYAVGGDGGILRGIGGHVGNGAENAAFLHLGVGDELRRDVAHECVGDRWELQSLFKILKRPRNGS